MNLTRLPPGAISALHHRHSRQDEFVYILAGEPTLFIDDRDIQLRPGMVAGFPAQGAAHHLENKTNTECVILEIGDRSDGDALSYPVDDLVAALGDDRQWQFTHKDRTPY